MNGGKYPKGAMIWIRKKIETVITGDNQKGCTWFVPVLLMASKAYGGVVKLRETFYGKSVLKTKRLPCFVISIGNITAGGTGKTPMTIYVADVLKKLGYRVVIISRGYKGGAETSGGIVSNGRAILMGAEIAGDEPYMMASQLKDIPVIVGKNRFKAGMAAVKEFNPDVLILDDAFQHLNLQRDIDLVLLDYRRPFGNGHLLPRGTLREPASALSRATAFILTRSDTKTDAEAASLRITLKRNSEEKPVFRSTHIPYIHKIVSGEKSILESKFDESLPFDFQLINGCRAFVFSGLAHNDDFHRMLEKLKCVVINSFEFCDHHFYSDQDIKNIKESVQRFNVDCLITTEKDFVRIPRTNKWPVDLVVVGIEVSLGPDAELFNTFIQNRIKY